MSHRVLREIAIFLVFFVFSVALTWPFARNLRTAVPDMGDPILNTFIIDWDQYALTHKPLHLFDAPLYVPSLYPLAYSENLVAVALIALPFHFFGAGPMLVYNIAFLLGFALAGYGASVLARVCGRSLFASMIAGVLFAFCQFKFDHLSHIQIVWSGWLPLMLAALFAYWRRPTTWGAVWLGAAFVANGLTNIHWLLFGSFALAMTIAFFTLVEWPGWKTLAGAVAALAIGSAILLPFLLPYRAVSHAYNAKRSPDEVLFYSATWEDWLYATPRNLMWGNIGADVESHAERKLFPGAMPIFLALAALLLVPVEDRRPRLSNVGADRRGRLSSAALDVLIVIFAVATYIGAIAKDFEIRVFHHKFISIDNAALPVFYLLIAIIVRFRIARPKVFANWHSRFNNEEWAALLWIAIGVLGSLGLHGVLHEFLYRHVEAFRGLRVPARWACDAYVGLVVWSSLGVDLLLSARRGVKWSLAAIAIAVASLLDVSPRVRWQQMIVEQPPVDRWLKSAPLHGLVMELPASGWFCDFLYLFGSTEHHQPIMNGTSGFEPPLHQQLRDMSERGEMNDVFLAKLEQHHCELIIVHADWLGDQRSATMRWLNEEVASGRLAFVRRFDHWIEGDYVFAVTHVSPDWQRFRGPQIADAAGFTPDQEAQRFLGGQATYNASTFWSLDEPRSDSMHHGPLRIAGWALSPNGVARVRVRINGGERVYDARFIDRPDVLARWPWYPKMKQPGFEVTLAKRPKGMAREINLQLEVVDGAGNVSRWIDIPVDWD